MTNILLILIFVLLILILYVFIFAVGFFVGFTRENYKQRYKKAPQGEKVQDNKQKAREEKAKRDWQRFLCYDGSNNTDGVTGK